MRWHLNHKAHGRKPWAVQTEYLNRAAGRQKYGALLEQGLGKTPANLNEFIDMGDVDLNIVMAPSSFMGDWPLACDEWGLGFLRTAMWPAPPPLDWDSGLYAISHETLRGSLRAREAMAELFETRKCLLTFDEATGIKNPTSLLAKWMMSDIAKLATRTRLLDGTPLVLNVMDYYAKLRCLGELNGVNPFAFRGRYARMGGFMGRQIVGIKEEREQELGQIIDGVAFRALEKDWRKDMPALIEKPVHLEMTDNQRRHYQTMAEEFYADVGDEVVTAEMVLTQRIKFQQISSCLLMKDDRAHWIEPPKNNPKLKAIFDLFDSGLGKAIIVYFFDPSGRMLIEEMKKAGLEPAWITGGMTPAEIIEQKRRFNEDTNCRVLVGQEDQTSRGHTLVGDVGRDRCWRMFFYENSLSLMHRLQMRKRNHRGDQDHICYIYDLLCSPIDQLNIDILTGKKDLADGMDAILKEIRRQAGN